ncbi:MULTISPECIES: EamA family transporter RarD [Exiguobacterium]|uniref:EamA family transporter RarD n=1 Tax=Exiguobacterium antarcticum TaxID=132920 RepID=A0ABT6QZL3_9BACL|nr:MULTISPECIES: EamA family transporter RarD [Exiguobacterium]AFS69906.1 RarD protein, DMT superfamily transporter [Exiguobacterium antarcticum B7]MCT4779044.1 EamA family transporter RarD [Exiguobacterium soli]MDI3234028.1 EamA family transporter RarD [Exiguobacterium antarcticum]
MNKSGLIATLAAYVIWGLLPIYWKLLASVSSEEILAHRIVWSFIFLMLLLYVQKALPKFAGALKNPFTRRLFFLNGLIISMNWFIYIWAVNHNFIVEASLGYYINPIVSIIFGVFFFREKLSRIEWLAIVLATIGVLILTIGYGKFPWISLALAFSFGFYGVVKKQRPLESTVSLTIETLAPLPIAILFLGYMGISGQETFTSSGFVTIGLVLTGVITAVPLLLFGFGAQRIPFTVVGFLQFVAPTLSLAIGVLLYDEPFTRTHLIAFTFIWSAALVFTLNGLLIRKKQLRKVA